MNLWMPLIKRNRRYDLYRRGRKYRYDRLRDFENYVIKLKEGVTLASDRGFNGSLGGKIFSTYIHSGAFVEVADHCRITGLTIQGPDPKLRDWKGKALGTGILIDGSFVSIDNCEISGFNKAAIAAEKGKDIVIKHCFIHDNKSVNAGYESGFGRLYVDRKQLV